MKAIEASYRSECTLCECEIEEGDEIVNADGDWVHADCGEADGVEVER